MRDSMDERARLPLLVTGIAGVAGYNALAYFQARYPGQVIGIRQRNNWRLNGDGIVVCDAEDRDGLARLFEKHHFRSRARLRRQLRAQKLRARSGDGLADQRRRGAKPARADGRNGRGWCICRSTWCFPARPSGRRLARLSRDRPHRSR